MKTILSLRTPTNRSSLRASLLIPLLLACFALAPEARATCQEACLTNENTVLGDDALVNNTGLQNTAIGFNALISNTIANYNTAIGSSTLFSNTTGDNNTAIGDGALADNTLGNDNTANGVESLVSNTTGSDNTASGFASLVYNTTGNKNTAIGFNALFNNTTGKNNIAIGSNAGFNLTTGSNNIDIFDQGVAGEANTIRIGKQGVQRTTFIAGVSGATVPGGVGVIVGANGQLGTVVSSERFKDAIKPMDKASEAILALKPVTFRYKRDLDPAGIPQFGLVAEQVEKVNPDLVVRDEQGKPYTVRYEAVNAMLLNEFLKEHREVQEQKATITQLKTELQATATRQQRQVEALTAELRKVSATLELGRSVPQTIASNQ